MSATQTQIQSALKSNPSELIKRLREEAARNEAFSAVCHVFALRERARQQVTLSALRITMQREGYNFKKEQYEHVLRFLANLGVGVLKTDSNGQMRSLENIKITLQSIGLAALGKQEHMDKFAPQLRLTNLPGTHREVEPRVVPAKKAAVVPKFAISIVAEMNGQKVNFPTPVELSLAELNDLLISLGMKK